MEQKTATVYPYSYWDEDKEMSFVADGYATLEAIENGLGVPILTARKQVPESEVIGGIWKPPLEAAED